MGFFDLFKKKQPDAAPASAPVESVKSGDCDVVLTSIGSNKIAVIKEVRDVTKMNLADVKDAVERTGVVASNLSKDSAEKLVARLIANGAQAYVEDKSASFVPSESAKAEPVSAPELKVGDVCEGKVVYESEGLGTYVEVAGKEGLISATGFPVGMTVKVEVVAINGDSVDLKWVR